MTELFWAALPSYLAIGMSADEFWYGDPRLCKSYRDAYEIRCDNKYADEWREGQYTMQALEVALDRMLYGGKNRIEYPERPLYSSAEAKRMAQEEQERKAIERDRARMQALAAAWNRKFKERAATKEEDPPQST